MMALPMTLVVGVLMLPGVQASDIADGSKNHEFLSEYMPLRSGYSKSSIGHNGKFMAHHLKHMEHGGRPEASSDHNDLAEDNYFRADSSHQDWISAGVAVISMPTVD